MTLVFILVHALLPYDDMTMTTGWNLRGCANMQMHEGSKTPPPSHMRLMRILAAVQVRRVDRCQVIERPFGPLA